ncbi:MAG: histidinol-phosphatase [Pseudomonadota bacterium]
MTKTPDIAFFQRLAAVSAAASLPHFRAHGAVENKLTDGFDPVTAADRAVESALREVISEHYPDHGILGEEFDLKEGDGVHQWVLDPIDGTRAFISGLPVWGVLAGLNRNDRSIAGMMYQPFTDELFCADEDGSWYVRGDTEPLPLQTRTAKSLADATLFTTSPHLFEGAARDRFSKLEAAVKLFRYGCDCYAFAMLAAGHADIVVEPGLQPYDICGLISLIEKAGGVVTDWDGGRPEAGGNVVAAATAELHDKTLALLNPK